MRCREKLVHTAKLFRSLNSDCDVKWRSANSKYKDASFASCFGAAKKFVTSFIFHSDANTSSKLFLLSLQPAFSLTMLRVDAVPNTHEVNSQSEPHDIILETLVVVSARVRFRSIVNNNGDRKFQNADIDEVSDTVRKIQENSTSREKYDLLGVSKNASVDTIRRAYYMKAKNCHPDRNPGDKTATEKFQILRDAYELLSNEKSRREYDSGVSERFAMFERDIPDPQHVFDILFGVSRCKFLVGDPSPLTSFIRDDEETTKEAMKRIQDKRVKDLHKGLKKLMQPWIDGENEAFTEWACSKAECLADVSFGSELLCVIGKMYKSKAAIRLNKGKMLGIPSTLYSCNHVSMRMWAFMCMFGAALDTRRVYLQNIRRFKKVHKCKNVLNDSIAHRNSLRLVDSGIHFLWKFIVCDVQDTLDCVLDEFLQVAHFSGGKNVDLSLIEKRARGLRTFGDILLKAGQHIKKAARQK